VDDRFLVGPKSIVILEKKDPSFLSKKYKKNPRNRKKTYKYIILIDYRLIVHQILCNFINIF
jgi:hypothetical protein